MAAEFAAFVRQLRAHAGFDAVESETHVRPNQLRLLGRVPPAELERWRTFLRRFLALGDQVPWKADVSKYVFLRDGALVYAWRIVVQGEGLAAHAEALGAQVLPPAAPAASRGPVQVTEMPLVGVSPDRNNPAGTGRGAHDPDRASVGPLAAVRLQSGG